MPETYIFWLCCSVIFIIFWIVRALVFYTKANKMVEFRTTYRQYLNNQDNRLIRNKSEIISLFNEANVPNFNVSHVEYMAFNAFIHELNGFQNMHLLDNRIIHTMDMKFDEAIGVFQHRAWQSINPIHWIQSIIFLPKLTVQYIMPDQSGSWINLLQVLYWIAMVAIGLHNANIIDLSSIIG